MLGVLSSLLLPATRLILALAVLLAVVPDRPVAAARAALELMPAGTICGGGSAADHRDCPSCCLTAPVALPGGGNLPVRGWVASAVPAGGPVPAQCAVSRPRDVQVRGPPAAGV
jgi:hypothetical protein